MSKLRSIRFSEAMRGYISFFFTQLWQLYRRRVTRRQSGASDPV